MSKITIVQDPSGKGRDTITIEDAKIITEFNNFSGIHGFREDDSRRTLCVIIDDPNAQQYFIDNGWNLKPRTGEDPRYLQIQCSYRFYNPNDKNPVPTVIEKDPGTGKLIVYDESTISSVDSFRRKDGFEHCDLVFKGSPYEGMNGSGVTGYLQWMQFTPHYNEIEETIERLRYAEEGNGEDVPF